MKLIAHSVVSVLSLTLATFSPMECLAEDAASYPSQNIKVIVPFPAGGTADILPRIVAEKLRQKWNQPIIIENRSGAGGNIGADAVATSAPDGYTLLASPPGPIAINESLFKKLSFKPSDLVPITIIGTAPNVLDVRPGFPAKTVQELIAYAKANPNKVSFASQGNGSTSHLTAVLFQKLTGIQMLHVPYRGTAPALQDIMAETVDLFFDNLGSSLSLQQGGAVRILGVCGTSRAPSLPDIPTVQEAGVRDFSSVTWFGLMAPKDTPAPIIDKLNAAVTEILKDSDTRAQFLKLGVEPAPMDSAATAKFIDEERTRWKAIISSADVAIE